MEQAGQLVRWDIKGIPRGSGDHGRAGGGGHVVAQLTALGFDGGG